MRENNIRPKLQKKQPVFGVISGMTDPKMAELIGLAGFDFYMLDAEHGPVTPAQAVNIVRACETVGIAPLARVSQKDPKAVLPYLDAGVLGIMMPGLETPAEIQMLVQAVKYPPLGKRGLGLARAADYMMDPGTVAEYVVWANENTLVLPQFEDVALLERLPTLTAVAGVDGFVIGPRDLAMSMGFADGPDHPEVQTVIDEAVGIIQEAGLWVGITAGTAVAAQAQLERGATLILNSVPGLIRHSADVFLRALNLPSNSATLDDR